MYPIALYGSNIPILFPQAERATKFLVYDLRRPYLGRQRKTDEHRRLRHQHQLRQPQQRAVVNKSSLMFALRLPLPKSNRVPGEGRRAMRGV